MNNMITIEEIAMKEISSDNVAISLMEEIMESLAKENLVKTNYHYTILKEEDENLSIRMYSLIKHIFKIKGWVLEINFSKTKDNKRIYNAILTPINMIYV